MSFDYTALVPAPLDDVREWLGRPGASLRLRPAWIPFQDQFLQSLRPVAGWGHDQELAAENGDNTRVTDRVSTRLPSRLLNEIFAYRARQLTGDLAAFAWARQLTDRRMTVAITGSSGMIGSALAAFLDAGGHRVIRLVRREPAGPDERRWDVRRPDPQLLEGVGAVVHLAGASIVGRFSPAHMERIRDSRLRPTAQLAELAGRPGSAVESFVAASAVGYYGSHRGDDALDEGSPGGEGFLAEVVAGWEAATAPARSAGTRVVNIRLGLVQSPSGGVLRLLFPVFTAGLGGRLADGRQWVSWIGLDDVMDVFLRALSDPGFQGPVNGVTPTPVRNAEYAATLARVLRRPAALTVPEVAFRFVLGDEGARELALASQRVAPVRLLEAGHRFRYPELESLLRHALGRTRGVPLG